jgi:hypothetical protein
MSETDGKINWFEVPAENADRARSFYGALFDWTFRPFDDAGDYQMTDGGRSSPPTRRASSSTSGRPISTRRSSRSASSAGAPARCK